MKSQSTIIGRVMPGFVPLAWKEVKYLAKYYDTFLLPVLVILFAGSIVTLAITAGVNAHHRDIANAAKSAHYQVGQTVVCNLVNDGIADDGGWHPCKINSISKDKTHYQVTFQSPSAHRTIDYNFSVLDVGNK